ncbi:MAG: FixH family protein [Chloroflexota bacterium]|nr:FixH family protein [Chloroflexota bacterium]
MLIFTLAGCRESLQATPTPDSASARLDLRAEPDPPTSGDGTLMVTVTDAAGQPIDGASVSARGDMTHAGMSPTFGLAAGSTNGVYRIPFAWKMGGDWIVTVTAVLPDGTTLTGEYSFTVEGS